MFNRNYKKEDMEQDAYKLLCQLNLNSFNANVVNKAINFFVATGESHLAIGLLRKFPELLENKAFTQTLRVVVDSNPESCESLFLSAIIRGINKSQEYAEVRNCKKDELMNKICAKNEVVRVLARNEAVKEMSLASKKNDVERALKTYRETRAPKAKQEAFLDYKKKCELYEEASKAFESDKRYEATFADLKSKNRLLAPYSDVERGYVEASKAFVKESEDLAGTPRGLMCWVYSQLALRDIGVKENDEKKIKALSDYKMSQSDDWSAKWGLLELRSAKTNNPYEQNIREAYRDPAKFSADERVEMESLSINGLDAILRGKEIKRHADFDDPVSE